MALHLNLLHEELTAERQRRRDPLKIGTMVLLFISVLMALFYMWKGYETLGAKSRLAAVEREWAKVEPDVTAAQKRSAELSATIATTTVLDNMAEHRFYWAPVMERVARSVAPNAQITALDGMVNEETKSVSITIEGVAAGREPRAAAEELRQLLGEQLTADYTNVKVEFKTLEDLDTIVNVANVNTPMARFTIGVTLDILSKEAAKVAAEEPAARRRKR